MTGRRKSGRKSGTSSKKETPEKARRSSRRRGQKRSESEPDDESGSERSVDGREEEVVTPKKIENNEATKEDESGGSDGSWQVRSENGNKGGIPKLKISLHRPAETSSPTPEPLSSPKPRRPRRGAASPSSSRNEDVSEDGDELTARGKEGQGEASENEGVRTSVKKPKESSEDNSESMSNHEAEIHLEAERKILVGEKAVTPSKRLRDEETKKRDSEKAEAKSKAEEELEAERKAIDQEKARRRSLEEKEAARKSAEAEVRKKEKETRKEDDERDARRKAKEIADAQKKEAEEKKKVEDEEKRKHAEREARRKAKEERELVEVAEREAKRKAEEDAACRSILQEVPINDEMAVEESDVSPVEQVIPSAIPDKEVTGTTSPVPVLEIKKPQIEKLGSALSKSSRKKRSPSRDSSEERAKQAALASRRKSKRREGSEDGEVVDSPETEIVFPVRTEGRIRTTMTTVNDHLKENKDNVPVVRKRRWGSSGSQASKKPSLVISTDVLKEIIPDVKSVPVEEIELLANVDASEAQVKPTETHLATRSEESRPLTKTRMSSGPDHRRRRSVPSDESEKDYEEEGVESGGEEMVKKEPPIANNVAAEEEEKENVVDVKEMQLAPVLRPKVELRDPLESFKKQRSPSPARNPVSNVLFITNLVRPFTVVQLRDLLARTGSIVDDAGFWIDTIKSKCYVKYTNEEDSKATRHALHGVRWPASNPKQLKVEFADDNSMKHALEGGRPAAGDVERRAVLEERREREREHELREKERKLERSERRREIEVKRGMVADKEKDGREVKRVVERERERGRDRDRDITREVFTDSERRRDEKPARTVRKVTLPVREWDLGKAEKGFSPPPPDSMRYVNEREDRRKRDKERGRSSSLEPNKKIGRKEYLPPPPKMLLDDLFRKTKATPCIYWMPLSDHQIAEKEAQRRKHMEEHERKLAEERKRREAKRKRSRSRSNSPKK